jgi:DNA-binding transcriptional regulator/RsmH inhibitor MraZ
VDERSRVTVPVRLWNEFPGIDQSGRGKVLIEARIPGCLVVRPWEPDGLAALARRAKLQDDPYETRAFDDVFRQGRFEAPGRIVLYPGLLGHLHGSFVVKGVYLVRYADRLEIWSRYYRAKMLRDVPDLDDL